MGVVVDRVRTRTLRGAFWTSWILPLAAALFAIQFTEFYPDYAEARFATSSGEASEPAQSAWALVDWIPVFILVTGIIGGVIDAVPAALGIAPIMLGAAGVVAMCTSSRAKT